jgi:hypothetical protein
MASGEFRVDDAVRILDGPGSFVRLRQHLQS